MSKKQKLSPDAEATLRQFAKNCKTMIKSYNKSDTAPATFAIICRWDDTRRPDQKLAMRNPNLNEFDGLFKSAVDTMPDYIDIKVFPGIRPDDFEITEANNSIMVKDYFTKPDIGALGFVAKTDSDFPEPKPGTSMQIEYLKFEHKMATEQLAFQNAQKFQALNKEIEDLKKEIEDLEDDIETYKAEKAKLEEHYASIKTKIGDGVEKTLSGLLAVAANNPDGKLLGLIPNSMVAGFLGGTPSGGNNAPQQPRYAHPETGQIADFTDSLTDDDFMKVVDIFQQIAIPGNISVIHSKLTQQHNSSS